ncbi:hypothetical protein QWI17_07210 [Gilvimarinus sp. SDUM040013]|uniref:Uncharacterized protein n=1 Tax=Gilvimarinus gilvus TaxID=3058038 RepID=A0ABU4RYG1_9GAMM|nr:hypothetical protein [Gilvimarinus sp. SDUM040013]MDO3385621.1 hypothetical protein [Gilvimarinus sp. SDUM040013]MDX6849955.1 hypothetical protein [Gilvimarinus sp. SDUM040013]
MPTQQRKTNAAKALWPIFYVVESNRFAAGCQQLEARNLNVRSGGSSKLLESVNTKDEHEITYDIAAGV